MILKYLVVGRYLYSRLKCNNVNRPVVISMYSHLSFSPEGHLSKTIITAIVLNCKQISQTSADWPNLLFDFFPANSKIKIGNIVNEAFDAGCRCMDYGGIRSVYSKQVDLAQKLVLSLMK